MSDLREWLEADGLGGFASGTVSGIRTRRYHAILLASREPPLGRVVLVNGWDAWLETAAGTYALSSQAYPEGVEYPNGARRLESFEADPWPTWTWRCEDGTRVVQEVLAVRGTSAVCVCFRVQGASGPVHLTLRPFFSGRDYHAVHRENPSFRFAPKVYGEAVSFHPYDAVPEIVVRSNGEYHHQPDWYRQFVYAEERARGLDFIEDLAAPGSWSFDLSRGPAAVFFATRSGADALPPGPARAAADAVRKSERTRRSGFASRLHRSADAYLVHRSGRMTIIAGYPWFTDWGRDTFISLRGLCLGTGRLDDARDILLAWAPSAAGGILPNHFGDEGTPELNSVDASLWYVIAATDYCAQAMPAAREVSRMLGEAAQALLESYARGTRHRIHADSDGLLAAGEAGVQLTWMDAKLGDWVVTPRIGKPVEVQALWLNALRAATDLPGTDAARWRALAEKGGAAFRDRFWNAERGCLFDVVDVDHQPGATDPSFRPNQIFALGGLPWALIDGERAKAVVDAVEAKLWTPLGLRSLAPDEAGYSAHYRGNVRERDGAYHQGTVWPWLTAAFVEAFVRSRGGTVAAKRTARERFLPALIQHLDEAGIGHVSEIADASPPHRPRGCPFQAWSVGELIRAQRLLEQ
jgi:predicted glycogen debranching enzyme